MTIAAAPKFGRGSQLMSIGIHPFLNATEPLGGITCLRFDFRDAGADGEVTPVGSGVCVEEVRADADTAVDKSAEHGNQDDDALVAFAFHPAATTSLPVTWAERLVSTTSLSWMLSIAIHVAIVAVGWLLLGLVRNSRPAVIEFAYGDASAEVGLKYREGPQDLPPGWDGLASTVINAPSGGQQMPAISTPTVELNSDPATPVDVPITPPPEVVLPPPMPEPRLSMDSAVETPRPAFQSKFPAQPTQPEPVVPAPSPADTNASKGTANAAMPASDATGQSAGTDNGDKPAAENTGGDGTANGQGGAATGAGGTAATGIPGIPAGVRDGDRLPTPIYPELSRRRGERGEVRLLVEVLADGSVGQIQVVSDAGFPRLAEAATASLRGHIFRPATEDGVPVRSTLVVPFRFNLR